MSASIKKKKAKIGQSIATNMKLLKQTNKTNKQNNKRPFFLPKINKVFLSPILQNLKGKSVLDNIFFERDATKQKVLSF